MGRPVYRELGATVGTSGDTNGDGLNDIFLTSASDLNFGKTYSRLEFLGAADFGAGGEFPDVEKRINEIPVSKAPIVDPPVGDINGDGFVDRLQLGPENSSVYVLFGNEAGMYPEPSELDGTNGFSILGTGDVERARAGFSIAIGDLNGDGFGDVLMADSLRAPDSPPFLNFLEANVYVVFGRETHDKQILLRDVQREIGFRIQSQAVSDLFFDTTRWLSVASGFDINGDHIDGLLIGDPFAGEVTYYESTPAQYHGEAYVIFGRQASTNTGTDAINDLVDVPVGAQITYSITGTLKDGNGLTGRAELQLGPDQVDLFMNELFYTLEPLVGDIDQNGKTEYADFLILTANFGKSDVDRNAGDLNGDGQVRFADFLLLSQNFS